MIQVNRYLFRISIYTFCWTICANMFDFWTILESNVLFLHGFHSRLICTVTVLRCFSTMTWSQWSKDNALHWICEILLFGVHYHLSQALSPFVLTLSFCPYCTCVWMKLQQTWQFYEGQYVYKCASVGDICRSWMRQSVHINVHKYIWFVNSFAVQGQVHAQLKFCRY